MMDNRSLVPVERIEQAILLIRGHKVMLSHDLAGLYGVEPRALVQAVKRNIDRFPDDFMFQLTGEEFDVLKSQTAITIAASGLRSQIVILETGRGRYPKYPP